MSGDLQRHTERECAGTPIHPPIAADPHPRGIRVSIESCRRTALYHLNEYLEARRQFPQQHEIHSSRLLQYDGLDMRSEQNPIADSSRLGSMLFGHAIGDEANDRILSPLGKPWRP